MKRLLIILLLAPLYFCTALEKDDAELMCNLLITTEQDGTKKKSIKKNCSELALPQLHSFLKAEFKSKEKQQCLKAGKVVYIERELFGTAYYSTVLRLLLKGDTDKAIKQIGVEIGGKILALHEQIVINPCNLSPNETKGIYPILRVVAAINANHPIPEIDNNNETKKILELAIKEDPQHYKSLLKQYK